MKKDTTMVNFEPYPEQEEITQQEGCLIFIGTVIFVTVLIVAFVAKFFNSKMF